MPFKDGTGPGDGGLDRGRGQGTGGGQGRNQGNRAGAGGGGMCVCPQCKTEIPHSTGIPCNQNQCPNCGNIMVRK